MIFSPLPSYGGCGGHVPPTLILALSQTGGKSVIEFIFRCTQKHRNISVIKTNLKRCWLAHLIEHFTFDVQPIAYKWDNFQNTLYFTVLKKAKIFFLFNFYSPWVMTFRQNINLSPRPKKSLLWALKRALAYGFLIIRWQIMQSLSRSVICSHMFKMGCSPTLPH